MNWQPIETAPKDGTRLLLANPFGSWMGEFVDRYTSGYRPSNPWQPVMLNMRHMSKGYSLIPTHWAHLPPPPPADNE